MMSSHVLATVLTAASLTFFVFGGGKSYAAPAKNTDEATPDELVSELITNLQDIKGPASPETVHVKRFNVAMHELHNTLDFAERAFARADNTLGADALVFARGLVNIAHKALMQQKGVLLNRRQNLVPGRNMRKDDIQNVELILSNIADSTFPVEVNIAASKANLVASGFNFVALDGRMKEVGLTHEAVFAEVSSDKDEFKALSAALQDILTDASWERQISDRLAVVLESIAPTMQKLTDYLEASNLGDMADRFDSLANSMGFGSFSALVDAINNAYGTNFTEQELRDALSQ